MRRRERERKRETRKEKKLCRHTETPMTTPLISLKGYRQDKSNDTEEGHE
jgi:hypothetical protein